MTLALSAATPRPSLLSRIAPYAGALGCAAGMLAVAGLAGPGFDRGDVAMTLLLGVLVSGAAFGLRPALVCAAASGFGYNFLFLEPRLTLAIARPADLLTFAVFFAAALATGWLSGRARDSTHEARARQAETVRLLASTRRLASSPDALAVAEVVADQASEITGADVVVLVGGDETLAPLAVRPAGVELDPASDVAARWCIANGEPAGAGTDVTGDAAWALRPLPGSTRSEGVLALRAPLADPATARLLQGVCDAAGLALERARLARAAGENEALKRTDRLRTALLNSLSHDLRTPLAGILGSATTLLDYGERLTPDTSRDLLQNVRDEAERLRRYISDLMALSKLEAGAVSPRMEWTDLRDVAAAAAVRTAPHLQPHPFTRDLPRKPALARVDAVLLEQALVNVLENAAAHTPASAAIRLSASRDEGAWRLMVEDDGPGLPHGGGEAAFTPFLRLGGGEGSGAGLGLSIARGFVESMGGALWAEGAGGERGARFVFRFPDAEPAA